MAQKILIILLLGLTFCGCGRAKQPEAERVMHISAGGRVKSFDPALAEDLASRNLVACVYDTLLQYNYTARPYRLEPSMLEKMPEANRSMTTYTFKLRSDLYFRDDKCFAEMTRNKRRITSPDVVYSFLRIADARLHSPVFWIFRNRIKGIDRFRSETASLEPGDNAIYDRGIEGFEIIDDQTFRIHLNSPDPRFLYNLAIPYASIVSRRAVEYYGEAFMSNPIGSGPFILKRWIRDFRIELERNPEYRQEFFKEARNPADREKELPLMDRIVCYQVKQPFSAWLLFLQGRLDMSAVEKDNLDSVVSGRELAPELRKRGIQLWQVPEFEIRYIGFNFTDPLLGRNEHLRRAISLAHNLETRLEHFNGQIVPANGPIPPGVAGFEEGFINSWNRFDLEAAREEMRLAGYPDGIDPATGKPLELSFDQAGNSSAYRQMAELMIRDMKQIGIEIKAELNNQPRFYQKLRNGQVQLFRLSWIGDYPDAENFLQLFYSKNAGGSNRVCYRDPVYDKMFEEIINMPDSPARTEKYRQMARYLVDKCPWIFESHPIMFQLTYDWLENYRPHDFAFSCWKYLSLDPARREESRSTFKPLSFEELRK